MRYIIIALISVFYASNILAQDSTIHWVAPVTSISAGYGIKMSRIDSFYKLDSSVIISYGSLTIDSDYDAKLIHHYRHFDSMRSRAHRQVLYYQKRGRSSQSAKESIENVGKVAYWAGVRDGITVILNEDMFKEPFVYKFKVK